MLFWLWLNCFRIVWLYFTQHYMCTGRPAKAQCREKDFRWWLFCLKMSSLMTFPVRKKDYIRWRLIPTKRSSLMTFPYDKIIVDVVLIWKKSFISSICKIIVDVFSIQKYHRWKFFCTKIFFMTFLYEYIIVDVFNIRKSFHWWIF